MITTIRSKTARLQYQLRTRGLRGSVLWVFKWLYWNTGIYRLRLHHLPTYWQRIADTLRTVIADVRLLGQPYEPDVSAVLKHLIEPGWTCVDVGANIGQTAILLCKLVGAKGKVIAFEAYPPNAVRLRRNMLILGQTRRLVVENMAISDGQQDRVLLFPGRAHSSTEWNIVGHDVTGQVTTPELEVPAISLDDYFLSRECPDFIKIDIEGAEASALVGARRLLREAKPKLIVEFHNDTGWDSRQELYEAGYVLYTLDRQVIAPDSKRVYQCVVLPTGEPF